MKYNNKNLFFNNNLLAFDVISSAKYDIVISSTECRLQPSFKHV
jgi:hypothetical protein